MIVFPPELAVKRIQKDFLGVRRVWRDLPATIVTRRLKEARGWTGYKYSSYPATPETVVGYSIGRYLPKVAAKLVEAERVDSGVGRPILVRAKFTVPFGEPWPMVDEITIENHKKCGGLPRCFDGVGA